MVRKGMLLFLLVAALATLPGCIIHDPGYYPYDYDRGYYYGPYYPYYYGSYLYAPFWFDGFYFHGDGHRGFGGRGGHGVRR